MPFDHITHHITKNPENGTYVLSKVTPIVRVGCADGSFFLQNGRVLSGGGDDVKDLPGWFYSEVVKLTPKALAECGFKDVPRPPSAEAQEPTAQEKVGGRHAQQPEVAKRPNLGVKDWQCPDCGHVLNVNGKEEHIAAHNRRRSPEFAVKDSPEAAGVK